MKRILLLVTLVVTPLWLKGQSGMDPDPYVDIIHYEFNVELNDSTDAIRGTAIIDVYLKDSFSTINLQLENQGPDGKGMRIHEVLYNGLTVKWVHSDDRIILSGIRENQSSTGKISITYSGIPGDGLIISRNKFGKRTFFADHWPDRASGYLPVVTHPSDKATVDFRITAPVHYEVVANGYLVEESALPEGRKLTHWKEEVPLPVKVMSFGAASFASQFVGSVDGVPVWTWVFPENRKEGFYDYSVAVKPLELYTTLIGPYPYKKLANVQSWTIFGGLENAGCIFYAENSVTGKGLAEDLIAHEIAHQWFGNSVTEGNWHHIWLSEGFATYLTSVYLEMNYGKERLDESMKLARERVIRAYERLPAPVIDTTITNLMRLLSANSYQKGSWFLHMLRRELGEEKFWKGIRLYYERFRNGVALTDDFKKVMEEAGGKELTGFFHQWLYVAGQPDLKITTSAGKRKGRTIIRIEQTQDHLFSFNIEILVKDSSGAGTITIPVRENVTEITVKSSPEVEIIPDPGVNLLFRSIAH